MSYVKAVLQSASLQNRFNMTQKNWFFRVFRAKKMENKKINYKSLIINCLEGFKPSKRCCIAVFALKKRMNQKI
jgi:hypothetical protein